MKMTRRSTPFRAVLGTWLMVAAALLLGVSLSGCKSNPANLYRTGYDKMLTPENWAARKPDEAVAIIGGFPSVWQKAGEQSYVFEARPRISIDWSHGFDVLLLKAGTYQLQSIVLGSGNFADFGGFQGLGVASGPIIASFEAGPGEVVYVGDFNANTEVLAIGNCLATLSVTDASKAVSATFAKQVPFIHQPPKTSLMTIKESLIRYPCGQAY